MNQPFDRDSLQARLAANEAELNRILAAPQLDQIMLAARVEELKADQDRIEFQLGQHPNELCEDPELFVARYRDLVNRRDEPMDKATRVQIYLDIFVMRARWKAWRGKDSLPKWPSASP
jgi:hypothetical protein